MHLRTFLALWLGKITKSLLLLFPQFGGFTAPGLTALKIDPNFVKNLGKQISTHIMISGTNGKTTTTRMIGQILKEEGINFINNRTGSNLIRGIASTLINQSDFSGKIRPKIALWEVDEAALLPLIKQVKPQTLVLTNLFRDQLDRYGEIDTLAKKWRKAIRNLSKNSMLILNADDPTLSSFAKILKNTLCFGLSSKILLKKTPEHASDASLCPQCLKPLKYKSVSYSHVGVFKPCSCGFSQARKKVVGTRMSQQKEGLKFNFKIKDKKYSASLMLEGVFNVYNALAVISVSHALEFSVEKAVKSLSYFKPAFGRSEKIKFNNKVLKIMLIKNPTGFNQVIDVLITQNQELGTLFFERCRCNTGRVEKFSTSLTLRSNNKSSCVNPEGKNLILFIAINDKIADGRDVSWLWDVNLDKLTPCIKKVIISGTRAYDLAVRIKYASNQTLGLSSGRRQSTINNQQNIIIEPHLKKAINKLLIENCSQLYILPTYTAMLEIREILRKKGLIKSSWKD